jgi:HEAT repeat protein
VSATEFVVLILWIEGGVVLVVLVCILGYGVYSRRRNRAREARLGPARALLARHLEDRTLSPADVAALRSLSAPDVIRLFFVVAPSVGLVEREWLREVAVTLGLVDNARARTEAEEWWNRLSGARFLSLVGAEPILMERLARDANDAVRAASAMFLAQYPTPTAVETLILMLDDESAVARFAAKDALMRLGAKATSAITKGLANADDRHVLVLLQIACAAPSHEYIYSAVRRRADANVVVRRLVARLFRGMGGEFATTQLMEMLRDADDAVREAAVEALGFLNHWSSAPSVAARLEDASSRVRLAAALALDRFGAPGELFLRRAVSRGSEVAIVAAQRILDDPSRLVFARPATDARE